MKRVVALLCAAVLAAAAMASCTPKPVSAEPVAQQFLADFAAHNTEDIAALVDDPASATAAIDATFAGLQAEGAQVELRGVDQRESIATATYSVRWALPKQRELRYDAEMTLTKDGQEWQVRWQPRIIHPNLGAHQHLELRLVDAERASVVSSDGVALMEPGLQYRLVLDPGEGADVRPAAAAVAAAVGEAHRRDDSIAEVNPSEVAKAAEDAGGAYSVAVYDEKQIAPIRQALGAQAGVRINEEPALVTREPGLAPDILSRVRTLVGDEINGEPGWKVAVVNQEGAELSDVEFHRPDPAPAVRVGLDYDVQRAAQDAVNARSGSQAMLVAIRPSTGEILAVAQTAEADKRGDLALAGQFPPGSVFKIITAAAGVQHQDLSAQSIVPCPGTMDLYGRTVTNYNAFSLGSVPLSQAFAQSCNTTFAQISTNLKEGELEQVGKQFGLGIDYDIPGLNTVTGSIPRGETPLDRTEAGYGQGLDLASPFGMALVSATVAAGKTPTPQLISSHKTSSSGRPPAPDPRVLENVRAMMRQVVQSGTAAGMRAGGTIYGKTGEAEINGGSHAWFTGYRDDDIAFATLVPMGGGSDVSVAITDSFLQKLDAYRAEPAAATAGD